MWNNNQLFFVVATILIIIVIIVIYYNYSSIGAATSQNKNAVENHFKKGVDHDTIYYKITDVNGNVSSIHDSGIKPSLSKNNVKIPVLKIEYNENQVKKIDTPVLIEYGKQIFDLKNKMNIIPNSIIDKGDYYVIEIPI